VRLVTPGRLLTLGGLLLAVFLALWVIPSHEYIFLPDRAHPVAPLVTIRGGHDPDGRGGIYFVDVVVRKATLLEELFGGLHEGADLYPASAVVPTGVSASQQRNLDLSEMRTSQQVAAAVALRALGRKVTVVPTGALVSAVEKGLPAAGRLEPTDVIVAINGKPVQSPQDVTRAMRGKPVGSTVRFKVRRGHTEKLITLKTVAAPDGSKRAIVGVILDQAETIHLPVRVSIDAGGVGGPSAGLAFALDVLEELGRNVDRGHKIAATGQIFLNGTVGPIGGIKQKTIGAREAGVDAFLVPVLNAPEAKKYAHGLKIIPVKSFQQALRALATLPASSTKS
jgi:PDZ domain-containing protein